MKTTTIFKMMVLFLIVLSVVSCTGNKGGLDNQESDTMMVAKDSIPFVLKEDVNFQNLKTVNLHPPLLGILLWSYLLFLSLS